MSRSVAFGAALAAGAVAALAFVGVEALSPSGVSVSEPKRPVTVSTFVEPTPALLGQVVSARAVLIVDRHRVDPGRVRLEAEFLPYAELGAARRSRFDSGPIAVLEYRFTLSCLDAACAPTARGRQLVLPVLRVSTPLRGGGNADVTARWPAVALSPRVPSGQVGLSPPRWRIQLALPPVSYRIDPGRLANGLTAVSALLAVAAFLLVGWELARRRRLLRQRTRRLSGLTLALELVRSSATRPPDDRRKALAQLARALAAEGNGDGPYALVATQLAWARPEPGRERIEALADEIELSLVPR